MECCKISPNILRKLFACYYYFLHFANIWPIFEISQNVRLIRIGKTKGLKSCQIRRFLALYKYKGNIYISAKILVTVHLEKCWRIFPNVEKAPLLEYRKSLKPFKQTIVFLGSVFSCSCLRFSVDLLTTVHRFGSGQLDGSGSGQLIRIQIREIEQKYIIAMYKFRLAIWFHLFTVTMSALVDEFLFIFMAINLRSPNIYFM